MTSHIGSARFGLCCTFAGEERIRFRTTTVAHLSRMLANDASGDEGTYAFYRTLVEHNLRTLLDAMAWCRTHAVHGFRVSSDLWPRATHPVVTGWVEQLFEDPGIRMLCESVRTFALENDIRLSEHPDQFLVGNSLRDDVVNGTIAELEFRARLGALLGTDVICLHVGSGAPDRETALWRWESTLARLSPAVHQRLAFENDDRVFAPEDILPACLAWGLPMVYDAHHHRVLADDLNEDDATLLAMASWGDREPHFHLSSPRAGWNGSDARPHHDVVDIGDWPAVWSELLAAGVRFTVDIEAKGKERAILALRADLLLHLAVV